MHNNLLRATALLPAAVLAGVPFIICETAGAFGNTPIDDPIPAIIQPGEYHIQIEIVSTELTAPNWGIGAPGDPHNRLFVTDQPGTLWVIDLGTGTKSVFLDVSARLVTLGIGGPGSFDERGLLGVAFHPNYQSNGLLYTYESHPATETPDFTTLGVGETPNHQTVITQWNVPNPSAGDSVVDVNSAREILRIDQPQFNHDAGAMNFGPDGYLYIALGDGGAGDDQGTGHVAGGNGQDITNILGSLIRIDPLGNNSANGEYGIPADNPFVGVTGVDEIYAYGLRNPFRFSFDQSTGALWLADAGQNHIEEVDVVNKGDNLGWPVKEGTFLFDMNGGSPGFVFANSPGVPADMVDPVAQYDHDEGIVVVGGFIYRGVHIPPLQGRYVFAEFAQSFSSDGRLFYLDDTNTIVEFNLVNKTALNRSVLGFGQGNDGEIYIMTNNTGTPFGDTGAVLKITTKRGDLNADGGVDVSDLKLLLANWNTNSAGANLAGPNDVINVADLFTLLASIGS